MDWLWGLFSCPECIVYIHPDEAVDNRKFDAAIARNSRIMSYLIEQIRHGQQ